MVEPDDDRSIGQQTRRRFLGAAAAATGAAAAGQLVSPAGSEAATVPACASLAPGIGSAPAGGRVDVHAHVVPAFYHQALLENGQGPAPGGYPTPVWTPERAIAVMDNYGVQMQVLSLSDPGVLFLSGAKAAALARQVNEYIAEQVKAQPTRFGGFATLPVLTDTDLVMAEIAYALDVLKLDGVGLFTSYNGVSAATIPQFEQIWAELDRRGAFVFVHPLSLPAGMKPPDPLPDFVVEYVFDTTRFCAIALNTGLTTQFPNLRLQLAHAGGCFPYLDFRVGVLQTGAPNFLLGTHNNVNGVLPASQQQGFYYDTALSQAAPSMRAVLAISDVNHIVFGSDWPYTEALFLGVGDPAPQLSDTFSAEQRHAIERGNILTQLPSVAARLGAPAASKPTARLGAVRVRRGRSGAGTVKFTVTTGGPAQISARIARGARVIASGRYPPVRAGRHTFELAPRSRVRGSRLLVTVQDGFGNQTTLTRSLAGA